MLLKIANVIHARESVRLIVTSCRVGKKIILVVKLTHYWQNSLSFGTKIYVLGHCYDARHLTAEAIVQWYVRCWHSPKAVWRLRFLCQVLATRLTDSLLADTVIEPIPNERFVEVVCK